MKPVVLYVEDDPQSRKVMEFYLRKGLQLQSFTIFEDSSNFQDRLQGLQPRPDVIFLDIHVKPASGFEMLDMIRSMDDFKQIPVVALTASVMSDEIHTLRTAGFNGCFSKPIDVDTFWGNLQRVMAGEHLWSIT